MSQRQTPIVAGIDVGGPRKGFHAIVLARGVIQAKLNSQDAVKVAAWCKEHDARIIGVDAPMCWSRDGRMRAAECELKRAGFQCFATPTLSQAENHPTGYYSWMLNGAALFAALDRDYRPFDGRSTNESVYFETFPQAIACVLAGAQVSAKEKRTLRRELLKRAGVDSSSLTNIDEIDAALCAWAALAVAKGRFRTFGQTRDGLIVLPTPTKSRS